MSKKRLRKLANVPVENNIQPPKPSDDGGQIDGQSWSDDLTLVKNSSESHPNDSDNNAELQNEDNIIKKRK